MSGYVWTVEGTTYTPDGASAEALSPAETSAHNAEIEAEELARWGLRPAAIVAYYDDKAGTIGTWLGTTIGTIVRGSLYRHNFGGRFIALTVRGTNGAMYHGRASYDFGTCILLRRSK